MTGKNNPPKPTFIPCGDAFEKMCREIDDAPLAEVSGGTDEIPCMPDTDSLFNHITISNPRNS